MDTDQDKLTQPEHPTDVAVRETRQRDYERPIEIGTVSGNTKGTVFGFKGDGGNGFQFL